MMDSWFFGKRIGIIVFIGWWLMFGTIHALVVAHFFQIAYSIAFVEAVITATLYALLSLGLWFWVRLSNIETSKPTSLITNHLGAAIVSIGGIVSLVNFLLSRIFSVNQQYVEFINTSIPFRVIVGLLVYLLIVLVFYLITYIQNYREQVLREAELQSLIKDAELNWLKLQLNPHFLFNSLNSISSLTTTDPQKAQEMVIRLSELLQYSLKQSPNSRITLDNELDNCIKYLEIEKIRFGTRLKYSIDTDPECLSLQVPSMIIQPLFENAIKHSVAISPEESVVKAEAIKKSSGVEIRISNTLHAQSSMPGSTGVGLANIRRRLSLLYGTSNLLKIDKSNNTFTAILTLPDETL